MNLRVGQPSGAKRRIGLPREEFALKVNLPELRILRLDIVFPHARAVAFDVRDRPGFASCALLRVLCDSKSVTQRFQCLLLNAVFRNLSTAWQSAKNAINTL